MKAIWSGSLSFGLLNIPVHVYSAVTEHKFGFKLLCGTCHKQLKNVRWCEHCKKEIAWDNTVKGFEKSKGSFVVLTHELISKLKPEKIDTIDIKEFVDQSEIEILYIKNHYYMLPSKEQDKAFYLFAAALQKSNKVAIAQFVMREKEYIVAISFYKNILLLNTLHYEYEIRTAAIHKTKTTQPTKEELSLALLLINKGTHKKFDLSIYKDTFVEKLKKALKNAKKTKKVAEKRPKKEKVEKKKKSSLAQSLKESLKEARA
jgi:DNA end-binding protein Ku